jgi:hypothetical protein
MSEPLDELDRKATELRVSGVDYETIAQRLGVTPEQAHTAVKRGLAQSEAERPARAIAEYQDIRNLFLESQEKAARGDEQARRGLSKLRKAYDQSVALARHLNPGWQPEPLPGND